MVPHQIGTNEEMALEWNVPSGVVFCVMSVLVVSLIMVKTSHTLNQLNPNKVCRYINVVYFKVSNGIAQLYFL